MDGSSMQTVWNAGVKGTVWMGEASGSVVGPPRSVLWDFREGRVPGHWRARELSEGEWGRGGHGASHVAPW